MKLGRVALDSVDGPVQRLVAVMPDEGYVVDLAGAECARLRRRGATDEGARRLATTTFPGSLTACLSMGDEFMTRVTETVVHAGGAGHLPIEGLSWLPAADPTVIRDCMAFEQHIVNAMARIELGVPELYYELPAYYKASSEGLIGHEAEVRWPGYTISMDYELELGFIIGRGGSDLSPEQGHAAIFGVTIYNDFSARDIQAREMKLQLGPAKGKDFATGLGPWVTTIDEVDIADLTMLARVNGEEWSRGNSGTIMWQPGEIVAYCSYGEHLLPGDVIGSGTVGGGCGLEFGKRLQPGDIVELEVPGVGVLRNRLGEPQTSGWTPTVRRRHVVA
jgi:2-keto-4-pentenoate hydratase/2-oxohepta-3-ene-1,7-dioic acid hydratase in catechol pathway